MKFFIRWVSYSFLSLLAITTICAVGVFYGLYHFGRGLPDHYELEKYNPSTSSSVFLQDGTLLKEFSFEKRHFIAIEKIPKKLKNAFLAAEDRNFYVHIGVDPASVVRSFLNNLINLGTNRRPQGASTITQQVARIFLVGNNEVSYVRKIREAILAFRIENALSKDKILELYLNQIYLGAGTYGVSAASKYYFGKSIDELNIGECSLLAALAKGATYYSPIKHQNRALARRNWVIEKQLEAQFITKEEYDESIATDIGIKPYENSNNADYYAEEVRKEILTKCPIESVNKDGLVVRVPLNMKFQLAAEKALKNGLEKIDRSYGWRGAICHIKYDKSSVNNAIDTLKKLKLPDGVEEFKCGIINGVKPKEISLLTADNISLDVNKDDVQWVNNSKHKLSIGDVVLFIEKNDKAFLKQVPIVQGAIIAMDPHTGRVLAMQGGYSFNQSEFNRATQSFRQAGSAFKPFVYLTALNAGYTPASIIDGSDISIYLGSGLKNWEPKNYNREKVGNVTLRAGIEKSLNTVTVRIAQEIGVSNIAETAEKLGVFEKSPKFLSIVLGACETTLMRMVNAYSIIVNGGKKVNPITIDQIQDKDGHTIYRSDNRNTKFINNVGYEIDRPPMIFDERIQLLDERSAYQIVYMLIGSVQNGTSMGAKQLNIPIGGKTGTSNDSKDNWFIGFTPNLVVGVMICFDDNSKSLGKRAVGATTALPIFVDFLKIAELDKKKIPFKVPSGICFKHINKHTGKKCKPSDLYAILEAFKEDDHVGEIIVSDDSAISNIHEIEESDAKNENEDNLFKGLY